MNPEASGRGEGGRIRRPLRLAAASPLEWSSGYDDLLAAVALALASGVDLRLVIDADGPDRERVLFTVHDLGLSDFVRLGPIDFCPDAYVVPPLAPGGSPSNGTNDEATVIHTGAVDVASVPRLVVQPRDPEGMARALASYADRSDRCG